MRLTNKFVRAPLSVLCQALETECKIHGDESLLERREKVARRVARSVPLADREWIPSRPAAT